jgi:ribonuclease Z
VTLLGTGAPPPVMERFGPSTLVEAGSRRFLFDVGRGTLQRLTQLNVRWQDVDGVFLTHLHSDHVVGFPDLWLTGWLVGDRRDRPLRVWGPEGTSKMMSHLKDAYEYDIRIRLLDDKTSPEGVVIIAKDIREGVIFDEAEVKVTAFEVNHEPVTPAFGYRVDYRGRAIVLSGDTRPSENLVRHARGVDLLIHEVSAPESFARVNYDAARVKQIVQHHTTPEQAGEVFAKTKPKLAVYSHVIRPDATEQEVMAPTRKHYTGPLELGADLMMITVGETVQVRRFVPTSR